jgi:hypothetical protein
MDWDVLFLIPSVWASAVLYPVLISLAMLAFGVAILYRSAIGRSMHIRLGDWIGWTTASFILIAAFCLGGRRISEPDYAVYFPWPLFVLGYAVGVVACVRTIRTVPGDSARPS